MNTPRRWIISSNPQCEKNMRDFKSRLRHSIQCVVLAVTALVLVAPDCVAASSSNDYPVKPITWVVGWPPGGSADLATRLVARQLEKALHQTVVIENKPGASGVIALNQLARSAADGYTIATVPGPVLSATPAPEFGKELVGVAMLGKGPAVLFGTTAKPMPATLPDLIAILKSQPGKFSFASSGTGTAQHLAGELFEKMTGTQMNHIPYKGGSQAVTDVIGGQVQLGFLGITAVLPHILDGKLRAYAVTTAKRSSNLPDTPALAETLPGFEATQWFTVAAPAGTPADRILKINDAINDILKTPEVIAGFNRIGMVPERLGPAQTTQFVVRDLKRWEALARERNLPIGH
ncbi:tripartite tricarboxylate transporter substrate binding protein [Candidimonas humi]|uniref:Bug family tripartite tricarboxylate transporter substrate binding protein n=1 Tax=Candidimonas humi TaxID=683355 RepID=A0ABV8NWC8_9BURK|nr:tripartite tricarboxylate transporter substrate binding protein [Candidimonas humi]MBV6303335.1 tripartite tricarboxylate transporter substrate binding protein [Candidimonas humi]